MLEIVCCMETLFDQLGLPSDTASIDQFIADNPIPHGVKIYEADFWNPSQAKFLKENLELNADWAIFIDELNARLHHD